MILPQKSAPGGRLARSVGSEAATKTKTAQQGIWAERLGQKDAMRTGVDRMIFHKTIYDMTISPARL